MFRWVRPFGAKKTKWCGRGHAKILAMNWLGPGKHIEVVEQEDVLLINVTGIKQSIDWLIPISVCVLMTYITWRAHSWGAAFGALFFLGMAILSWLRNEDGELRITEREILAYGDMGGWSKGYVRFRWADISGLDYRVGGEDGPSGYLQDPVDGMPPASWLD